MGTCGRGWGGRVGLVGGAKLNPGSRGLFGCDGGDKLNPGSMGLFGGNQPTV